MTTNPDGNTADVQPTRPQVDSMAANFHEGSRSELLAQYFFSSFGTAIPVPHQEDTGVDLYCTLTEQIGFRAWSHLDMKIVLAFSQIASRPGADRIISFVESTSA